MQKNIIGLKKLKIKIIKKRKEKQKKTEKKKRKKKEKRGEMESITELQKPIIEAEVYNNNRNYD